ncbi:hypothetical protein [Novosphingobium olei]|uniref:Uncharacterized protein n=1 Tax=Novosphingobium olei TaxID=2728851 RepID=A0A7Y0BP02_9SPHN|nr:hypothetical protein [Novosphingobium olei]NML93828.1 hypothetical protein [Novosphingobium olei]
MSSDVTVTQAHVGWAGSIAQHLCHSADRDAAIRLVADAFARFEAEVLARHRAPDAEPVAQAVEHEAVLELIAMLSPDGPKEEGCTVFDHSPEEIGLHVMENHEAIRAALAAMGERQ